MYAMSCDRVSDCASEPTAALWDLAVPATQSINPTRTIPRKLVQARSFRRIHTCASVSSEAIMLVMVPPLVMVDELLQLVFRSFLRGRRSNWRSKERRASFDRRNPQ